MVLAQELSNRNSLVIFHFLKCSCLETANIAGVEIGIAVDITDGACQQNVITIAQVLQVDLEAYV